MSFLLRIPIHLYRWMISPTLHAMAGGTGCGCRFHPSCSAYALEALRTHGSLTGLRLSILRISKCHPWNEGGLDPVPESRNLKFDI
jgi:putative membrane protein insertion efficiency factor